MQPVGERLEEARKRLGIALREASEATKIRSDYLLQMENGSFDFALPEIYKRGFLKIYARYLKLDVDKLSTDYNAQHLGASRPGRHEGQDNLGRVEMPGVEGASGAAAASEVEPAYRGAPAGGLDTGQDENRAAIIRLVAVLVVVALVVVGIIMGFKHMLGSADEGVQTAAQSSNTSATTDNPAPAPPPKPPAPVSLQFVLTAQGGDITNLTVVQASDHHELYNASLKRGKSLPVSSLGRAEISVSQTQFLLIEQNGKKQNVGDASGKPLTGPVKFYWPPGAP